MKKLISALLVCTMVMGITACGKEEKPAASNDSNAVKEETKEETGDMTPEQQAVLDEYNEMIDRYNTVVDKTNADENLLAIEEVVNTTNAVTDSLNEVSTKLDSMDTMTDEDIADLKTVIADTNAFIDELESMLLNYSGKQVVTIQATLVNNTGVDLYGFAMSPGDDDSWGGNLLEEPLKQGESGATTMNITEDTLVWDFLAVDAEDSTLEFFGLDFSNVDIESGATITLSVDEAGEYTATVE